MKLWNESGLVCSAQEPREGLIFLSCGNSFSLGVSKRNIVATYGQIPMQVAQHLSTFRSSSRGIFSRGSYILEYSEDYVIIVCQEPVLRQISLSIQVASISCSGAHCLVASQTDVYTYGSGLFGQLGLGHNVLKVSELQRVKFPAGETPRSVSAGSCHSCVVTEPSGTLYTFGCGAFHRLGHDGDDSNTYLPRSVSSLLPLSHVSLNTAQRGVAMVSCGLWHTVVVSAHMHDIYTWGWNNFGQCAPRIEAFDSILDDDDSVVDVACGTRFTAFRTAHGHVLAMGQVGASGIDNIDPGLEFWTSSSTPAISAQDDRQLRFLHRADPQSGQQKLSGTKRLLHAEDGKSSSATRHLAAYQWTLAFTE